MTDQLKSFGAVNSGSTKTAAAVGKPTTADAGFNFIAKAAIASAVATNDCPKLDVVEVSQFL